MGASVRNASETVVELSSTLAHAAGRLEAALSDACCFADGAFLHDTQLITDCPGPLQPEHVHTAADSQPNWGTDANLAVQPRLCALTSPQTCLSPSFSETLSISKRAL